MAFPLVEDYATTGRTAAETTSPVSYPATVSAGALLVCFIRVTVAGAIGWPAGWNEIVEDSSDASDDVSALAWKTATGNEGGTTFNVTHGNGKLAAIVYSVTGADEPTTQPPQISTVAVGTSQTPNPTTCTPTGGAKDYLWLWLGGWEGEQTSPPTGNPTNYTNPIGASTGTGGAVATNCRVASARRNLNAASEDPPSWTISASDDWAAWTMAIHPAPTTRRGLLAWTEIETPLAPRRGLLSWVELEAPAASRQGRVSWSELEAPTAPRRGALSWAEIEVPLASRRGQISWAELETSFAPRRGAVAWTEFEVPNASRRGEVSWSELEAPEAPRRGQLSWAELETPSGGVIAYRASARRYITRR